MVGHGLRRTTNPCAKRRCHLVVALLNTSKTSHLLPISRQGDPPIPPGTDHLSQDPPPLWLSRLIHTSSHHDRCHATTGSRPTHRKPSGHRDSIPPSVTGWNCRSRSTAGDPAATGSGPSSWGLLPRLISKRHHPFITHTSDA